jgi:N-terminal glutamine amidase
METSFCIATQHHHTCLNAHSLHASSFCASGSRHDCCWQVILVEAGSSSAGHEGASRVWDLDTLLPFPCGFEDYAREAFQVASGFTTREPFQRCAHAAYLPSLPLPAASMAAAAADSLLCGWAHAESTRRTLLQDACTAQFHNCRPFSFCGRSPQKKSCVCQKLSDDSAV